MKETITISEGGCRCGAVCFKTTKPPKFISNCHCLDCRKSTGAAFSTWVGFDTENIHWVGERILYESSSGVFRGFCKKCGTPLSYSGIKWPGETHILVGVFESPECFVPHKESFPDEKLNWVKAHHGL